MRLRTSARFDFAAVQPGAISTARRSRFSASRQPPYPSGKLGEHADRPGVERVFLEVRFEQPLGDVEPVLVQRHGGLDQAWVPMTSRG